MALSANMVWEVRTTGSDNNGGAFKAAATGTDYSQQDTAQNSGTDLIIDGTLNTKVTATGYNFASTDVGNTIRVTAGTGFTVGTYEIVSVAANAATLDRAIGTLGSTGGTWKEGGALLTIGAGAGLYVAGNVIFVKSGTYGITATIYWYNGNQPSATQMPTRLIGYTTTRGDGGRPTIQISSGSNVRCLSSSGPGVWFENFILDGNNQTGSWGLFSNGGFGRYRNVWVKNCTTYGIGANGEADRAIDCEVSGCGAASAVVLGQTARAIRCYAHDNTGNGFSLDRAHAIYCIADTNTGASHGFYIDGRSTLRSCVAYGNGGDGVRIGAYEPQFVMENMILVNNGGYGFKSATAGTPALSHQDGNAFYNNTSGARLNMDDTTGVNGVTGVTYTRTDITLTGDPFTNAAAGDFTLNNTAGAGAACRSVGRPASLPGVTGTGYPDLGVFQSQPAVMMPRARSYLGV